MVRLIHYSTKILCRVKGGSKDLEGEAGIAEKTTCH